MKATANQVEVEQMHFHFSRWGSVLIQYEAREYFGKGLEQSRLSLFLSPSLEGKHFLVSEMTVFCERYSLTEKILASIYQLRCL